MIRRASSITRSGPCVRVSLSVCESESEYESVCMCPSLCVVCVYVCISCARARLCVYAYARARLRAPVSAPCVRAPAVSAPRLQTRLRADESEQVLPSATKCPSHTRLCQREPEDPH